MSFDKNYPNRKDWRKQYYDSRSFDRTCRNHGSCKYCQNKRTFIRNNVPLKEELNLNSNLLADKFFDSDEGLEWIELQYSLLSEEEFQIEKENIEWCYNELSKIEQGLPSELD